MTPYELISKWRDSELRERQGAQEWFLDVCRLAGHPTPAESDKTGETFCFERGAEKVSGGGGWADVWKRGHFGWEFKGRHKDLDRAYRQLVDYRDALENPPLLVVSDFDRIRIHTSFTGAPTEVHEVPVDSPVDPAQLDKLRAVFFDPGKLRQRQVRYRRQDHLHLQRGHEPCVHLDGLGRVLDGRDREFHSLHQQIPGLSRH